MPRLPPVQRFCSQRKKGGTDDNAIYECNRSRNRSDSHKIAFAGENERIPSAPSTRLFCSHFLFYPDTKLGYFHCVPLLSTTSIFSRKGHFFRYSRGWKGKPSIDDFGRMEMGSPSTARWFRFRCYRGYYYLASQPVNNAFLSDFFQAFLSSVSTLSRHRIVA